MKHKLLLILQISITLALIVFMLTSGTAEAVTMKFRSSGKYAFVDFLNDTNCQSISGYVQVSEEMLKYAPGSPVRPGPMGFLSIYIENRADNDNDNGYGYGYGYDYKWGTAAIELTSFEVSGNLRSASAEGKGTLIWEQPYYYPYDPYYPYPPDPNQYPYPPYPYPYPPPSEEVTIKITWTGDGDMTSGQNTIRSSYGNIRMHMRSSGTSRDATATGLIKGETFEIEVKPPPPPDPYPVPVPVDPNDNYIISPYPYPYPSPYPYPPPYYYPAPYPYFYASIGKSKTGYMNIFKP